MNVVKILAGVSHVDHGLNEQQLAFIERALNGDAAGSLVARVGMPGAAFFIAEVKVPAALGSVPCALRGPVTGEPPVSEGEVFYGTRGTRPNVSRLTLLPPTRSDTVTVIGGHSKEHPNEGCILFTAYGGPLAPQEPGDPYLAPEGREGSLAFWREHALAVDVTGSTRVDGASWDTYSAPAPGK